MDFETLVLSKQYTDQKIKEIGSGGKQEPLIVNLLEDGTTDKSGSEIATAIVSGKPVSAFWNNTYVLPVAYDSDHVLFHMMFEGNSIGIFVSENSYEMHTTNIPTKPEDIGAQPKGEYLTAVPDGYAKTEDIPTDDHINELINTALGVIENGTY